MDRRPQYVTVPELLAREYQHSLGRRRVDLHQQIFYGTFRLRPHPPEIGHSLIHPLLKGDIEYERAHGERLFRDLNKNAQLGVHSPLRNVSA